MSPNTLTVKEGKIYVKNMRKHSRRIRNRTRVLTRIRIRNPLKSRIHILIRIRNKSFRIHNTGASNELFNGFVFRENAHTWEFFLSFYKTSRLLGLFHHKEGDSLCHKQKSPPLFFSLRHLIALNIYLMTWSAACH
jgi:hypothetical protein